MRRGTGEEEADRASSAARSSSSSNCRDRRTSEEGVDERVSSLCVARCAASGGDDAFSLVSLSASEQCTHAPHSVSGCVFYVSRLHPSRPMSGSLNARLCTFK